MSIHNTDKSISKVVLLKQGGQIKYKNTTSPDDQRILKKALFRNFFMR